MAFSSFFRTVQQTTSAAAGSVSDAAGQVTQYIKQHQPIHLTGTVTHTWHWLTSSFSDVFVENQNFDKSISPENRRTIYAIHGTADRCGSFADFSDRIKDKLPDVVSGIYRVTFKNRWHGKSIQDFAQQVLEKIIANGDKRVILMGHSRGGLVASYLKEYYSEGLKKAGIEIEAVICIASPFWGSYLALPPLTYFSRSVNQMETDSVFLRDLRDRILESEKTEDKYLYITAERDDIVKGNSSYLEYCTESNKENRILLDRHGHLSIMSSHRLVEHIRQYLDRLYTKELLPREHEIYEIEEDDCIEIRPI